MTPAGLSPNDAEKARTAFVNALEAGDLKTLRKVWAIVAPHLPQDQTDEELETQMHLTRTSIGNVSFKARAYSHSWLLERGLPSGLPDELKPKAERLYPRVVAGVGIACMTRNPIFVPAALEIRRSMEIAVEETFADAGSKTPDPLIVSARMREASNKTRKALFG